MVIVQGTETEWGTPGLTILGNRMVSFYLVSSGHEFAAFDTGLPGPLTSRQLLKLAIDPARVTANFLTHSDQDHAGGIPHFPQAALYLGKDEEPLVTGKMARSMGRPSAPLPRSYTLLADGQELTWASLTVKAIATPGHTPGSTCYLVAGKWLFVGDAMRLEHGRAVPFKGIYSAFNMDTAGQVASLRKLAKMDELRGVELICTAHSRIAKGFEPTMQAWR
jgi:glyoxylase-like metal-dependent hydrolase (beta-lactamase superfamily II)